MKSYRHSPEKQKNRQFKLKWAKRAMLTTKEDTLFIATLCGGSIWFESELVKFANLQAEKERLMENALDIESFNCRNDDGGEERQAAFNELASQPLEIREHIKIFNQKLSARIMYEFSPSLPMDFVDFDTCKWFFAENAKDTLELCKISRMLALTIIIKGRLTNDKYLIAPPGMRVGEAVNPKKVINWIESNSNMKGVDCIVYKNPGSRCTMATIIFERIESVPTDKKQCVRDLLASGKTTKEVADMTGFPFRSICAMKARLHKNFAHLRKNF